MLSEHQEVVAALTELARHYVLFAPGTLVQSPALPALVHWAVTAVQLREPEPVSPAAAFLTSLIAPPSHIASSQLWQARPQPADFRAPDTRMFISMSRCQINNKIGRWC